jgi:hypothetical protein
MNVIGTNMFKSFAYLPFIETRLTCCSRPFHYQYSFIHFHFRCALEVELHYFDTWLNSLIVNSVTRPANKVLYLNRYRIQGRFKMST